MVRFPFFGFRRTPHSVQSSGLKRGRRSRTAGHKLSSERLEPRSMLAAQILQVSTMAPNGSYNEGDVIPIAIDFSEAVRVDAGNPVLMVNSSPMPALFAGQNFSRTTMFFNYTVQAGDTSNVFDVVLSPEGTAILWGDIRTVSDNTPADREVGFADNTIRDSKRITIDTTGPAVPTVGYPTGNPGDVVNPRDAALTLNPVVHTQVPANTLDPRHGVLFGTYMLQAGAGEQLRVTVNGAVYAPLDVISSGPTGVVRQALVADGTTRIWAVDLINDVPVAGVPFAMNPWSTTNNQYYSVVAAITDAAGNVSTDPSMNEIRIDMTAPFVTNVTSPLDPGTYGVGSEIFIDVEFNEPIYVRQSPNQAGGISPRLHLNLNNAAGTASRFADFFSIESSGNLIGNVARFRYVVLPGDATDDLDYAEPAAPNVSALIVGGSYISDHAGNKANETLVAPGEGGHVNGTSGGSLGFNEQIVIDAVAPVVTNVTSDWGTTPATYVAVAGEEIPIRVVLSKEVVVTSNPTLRLRVFDRNGLPIERYATYVNNIVTGTGAAAFSTLNFRYTVLPGDTTLNMDLDYLSPGALILGAPGSIRDLGGNDLALVLASPNAATSLSFNTNIRVQASPIVTNVRSLTADGTYTEGQVIRLQVSFDQPVTVRGVPTLRLNGAIPNAMAFFHGYTNETGSAAAAAPSRWLEFRYLVRPGDTTTGLPLNELDYAQGTDLEVGTGAIYSIVTNQVNGSSVISENHAIRTLFTGAPGAQNWLGINNNVRVTADGIAPAAPQLALKNDAGALPDDGISNDGTVTVTFLEGRTDTTLPDAQWMRWQYYIRGVPSGLLKLAPGGSPWTAEFVLPTGVYAIGEVEAELIDPTGNVSARGTNGKLWVIERDLPPGLLLVDVNDTGASATDGITRDGTITVRDLEPNAQLRIEGRRSTEKNSLTPTLAPFTITIPSQPGPVVTHVLEPGIYTDVTVRQIDLAGNIGETTPVNIKLVDTTFPGPAFGPLASNRIDFPIGDLERFSAVTILVNGVIVYSNANYDPAAGTSAEKHFDLKGAPYVLQLEPGLQTITVRQTDLAGNTQEVSRDVDAGIYAYSTAFRSNPLLRLPVVTMTIQFNTAVKNVSLRSFKVLYNGVTLNLAGARVSRVNASTYVLTLPRNLTNRRGNYTVVVNGPATSIASTNGLATMKNKSYIAWRRG